MVALPDQDGKYDLDLNVIYTIPPPASAAASGISALPHTAHTPPARPAAM